MYYKVDVFAPDSDGKKKLLTVAELHDVLRQIFQWTDGKLLLCKSFCPLPVKALSEGIVQLVNFGLVNLTGLGCKQILLNSRY